MAEQTPPLKPQNDKPIEDLLNKDGWMMRSPVLWFALLAIPVVLGLYIGLVQETKLDPAAPQEAVVYNPPGPALEAAPATPEPSPETPAVSVQEGRILGPRTLRGASTAGGQENHARDSVACNYDQWIGKMADSALEEQIKAENRPYRILPPGAMMTMDFSAERINFETDAGGKITRVWCG